MLKVYDRAPTFTAHTHTGGTFNLQHARQENTIVLVFLRGFLCPFSRKHLLALRDSIDHFHSMDALVVVVARHDYAPMKAFWKEHKLPFIGIPDPQGKIGKQYDQKWKPWRLGLMPALFIVDRDGLIAHAHYSKGMTDIPSNESLFSHLRQLKR